MQDTADIPTNMTAYSRDFARIAVRPTRGHLDHLISCNRDLKIVRLRNVFRLLLPRLSDIRLIVAARELIIDRIDALSVFYTSLRSSKLL